MLYYQRGEGANTPSRAGKRGKTPKAARRKTQEKREGRETSGPPRRIREAQTDEGGDLTPERE